MPEGREGRSQEARRASSSMSGPGGPPRLLVFIIIYSSPNPRQFPKKHLMIFQKYILSSPSAFPTTSPNHPFSSQYFNKRSHQHHPPTSAPEFPLITHSSHLPLIPANHQSCPTVCANQETKVGELNYLSRHLFSCIPSLKLSDHFRCYATFELLDY